MNLTFTLHPSHVLASLIHHVSFKGHPYKDVLQSQHELPLKKEKQKTSQCNSYITTKNLGY